MKRLITSLIILITLTACTGLQVQQPEPTSTVIPPVNMPNPASVYCKQNGYELEIRTAADGSQSGVCIFMDGSSCDEWAYYRGVCGPRVENSPKPATTLEATTEAGGGDPGGNASGGYMPPVLLKSL
jgi:putative hemolysin